MFHIYDGSIDGKELWVLGRLRRRPVLNPSACDHLPPGAVVRSAKPQEYFLDFRRTDRHGLIGSAEAATPFLWPHENPKDGRNFCRRFKIATL
jgi:hypothetical protein